MHLEHHATQAGLAALTVRAPAAAPRFSFHSGHYCEECAHTGEDAHASLADNATERDLACEACCSYDALELDESRITRLGAPCQGVGCEYRLGDGAWIVADRAEAFALCFRCAVADVLEHAPLTLTVEAINIVGGEPTLLAVLEVLGYRLVPAIAGTGYHRNVVTRFGDVLLADVTPSEVWPWLHAQGVRSSTGRPVASIRAAVARGVAALQPAINEALRLRRELLESASIEDEVA
jgi:hypothetical protein